MNNNIIPACIIGAGLFAVALKPAPHLAPIPQAEPVAVASASVTGQGDPVIVWYGTTAGANKNGANQNAYLVLRAWSDGVIEAKLGYVNDGCDSLSACDWQVISSPQMACRTDINGNGEIEFGDLLAVLNQWGDQATCPDTVQIQCGVGLPTG